jgi:predicted kinase
MEFVMLVVLSGLPGVGKTTIARELAVAINAVHVRIDTIEQALRNHRWNVAGEGYAIAYAIAEDNLRLGRTVVADCVNPWPLTRADWEAVANRVGVRVVNVELVCSDLNEHRRRVESRASDIPGHRLPTWSEVVERDYRPWDGARLIIDTARLDVPQSLQVILSAVAALKRVEAGQSEDKSR